MPKTDRRVQRTRTLLQQALIELLGEQAYEAITIQDIADRANVGRTTFYLHYTSKDDLLLNCHEAIVSQFHFGPHSSPSRDELLSPHALPGTTAAYRHLAEARGRLSALFQGKEGLLLLRRLRDSRAEEIEANLQTAFAEADSAIPLDVLAIYLAGAQVSLMQWWLEKRHPHTPETLAHTFHRLQCAALCEAFGLEEAE